MSWRRAVLDAEEAAWRELCARFDALAPELWERSGATGDWTAKDVLAHIACWHATVTAFLERRRGGDATPMDWAEVDDFNRDAYERCRSLTLDEVKAMSAGARLRFRDEVAIHPADAPDPRKDLIGGTGPEHYAEHLPLLDAFLEAVRA